MHQIITFLPQSCKDGTMIYYFHLPGEDQRAYAICPRHTVNRWQRWDLNQGRLSLEHLLFSITSILVLSCNDIQMVQKSEWYKMVFIHKLCLSPTLSSLSQVFSLCKYMEIKTHILIYPPLTLFCLTFFLIYTEQ